MEFAVITLENIGQHTIPFDDFELKWRFTEEKYNLLPAHHLEQIRPLDKAASRMLNDLTNSMVDVGSSVDPLQFKHIEAIHVPDGMEAETLMKKWLYRRGLPFEQVVYVSWEPTCAVITNWKMFVRYWSDFWYPSSDDLVVIDRTLSWTLVFYHYDYIQFGTNQPRISEICENELIGTGSL